MPEVEAISQVYTEMNTLQNRVSMPSPESEFVHADAAKARLRPFAEEVRALCRHLEIQADRAYTKSVHRPMELPVTFPAPMRYRGTEGVIRL